MKKSSIFCGLLAFTLLFSDALSQAGFDQEIADLLPQVSEDSLTQHIQSLTSAGGHETRVSYTEGNRWSAEYIKAMFDSYPGLTSVAFDTFFAAAAVNPYQTEPLVNIIATLEGTQDPERIYVIGGHMDATGNLDPALDWDADWQTADAHGADDNATGVAAILEIARILSDPQNGFSPAYTIHFIAFGAEERHPAYSNRNHLGSEHYVLNAYANGRKIAGAFILDMIGYNSTGNDYFDIVSNMNSEHLGEALLEMKAVYNISLNSNSPPFPDATYSDHDQFWIYRYPAVLLIENAPPWENNAPWYTANPFYHKESDTYDTLNMSQIEKLSQLVIATVASLSSQVTSIEDAASDTGPEEIWLAPNHPNPFNAGTVIRFSLTSRSPVDLAVYNLRGEKVRQILNSPRPGGEHQVKWDGRDVRGIDLPSGIYLYRLQAGNKQVIRKMVLVR